MKKARPRQMTPAGLSWQRRLFRSSSKLHRHFLGQDARRRAQSVVRTLALLSATLASSGAALAQQTGQALPEGPAKSTVLGICGSCHDVGRLTAGYTPEGWHTVVRMMQNFGAPIPPDQVATITDYLTTNFPEKPRCGGADRRRNRGEHQAVAGCDARLAPARPIGRTRRVLVVLRPARERSRSS